MYLAQIAIGTLGVLVISSEYGTGMIRATLSAVPQRRAVLAAKARLRACTLMVGELLTFAAFVIGQAILSTAHAHVSGIQASASLIDRSLRAVIGGGLYLTAVGLLGFGLGALIRHTAGALSAFFGVLFASARSLTCCRPRGATHHDYMPANAGSQIHHRLDPRRPRPMGRAGRAVPVRGGGDRDRSPARRPARCLACRPG